MRRIKGTRIALLLLILHTSTANPTTPNKDTAPAVFEVINEQARIDEKKVSPYTNPLAGNSLQNAKLHAQNQQAMFNAERMRQHRAQLQRWNQQPPKQQVDSYMKAYQESQENHQLALEQMQSNAKDKKERRRPERPAKEKAELPAKERIERPERPAKERVQRPERPAKERIERPTRQRPYRTLKDRPQLEPVKLTRTEAIDKSRNHRSYGSLYPPVPYHYKKRPKVNTYPGPTYDQGVTIKPNGNVGLTTFEKERHPTLYTEAVPSKTHFSYPKQYSQAHPYQSANDISALKTLLNKPPQEQLTQFNSLVHHITDKGKDPLETPIDLFFYAKDPPAPSSESAHTPYALYAPEYPVHPVHPVPKDHIPITEEVDDVENDYDPRVNVYKPPPATPAAPSHDETTTTTSNYYKIEVEQTVSGNIPKNIEYSAPEQPSYETIAFEQPLNLYHGPSTEGVKYLHSEPTVVQHINPDGTEVSAFGEDDIHYAANYEFGYRVRDHETGNDFGHQESKSGDKTRGQYHVLLPDGRLQQVRYSAGPDGFHADISYDHLQ